MTRVTAWSAERAGRADAARGVYEPGNFIESRLGARPQWSPDANDAHRVMLSDLNPAELPDVDDDVRHLEQEAVGHIHPWVIAAFMLVLFAIESLASVGSMRWLGVDEPAYRIMYGLGLACLLIFLAHVVMAPRLPAAARAIGLLILLCLAGVLGVTRGSGLDGSSQSANLGAGMLLMFLTLGPALLCVSCWHRLNASALARRRLRQARSSQRHTRERQSAATGTITRIGRQQSHFDEQAARLRAAYNLGHKRTSQNSGGTSHD